MLKFLTIYFADGTQLTGVLADYIDFNFHHQRIQLTFGNEGFAYHRVIGFKSEEVFEAINQRS